MKVVHLTTSSKGGAGIAAMRLHEGLCKIGVNSAYLSTDTTINFQNVKIDDTFFAYQRPSFFKKLLRKLKAKISPTTSQKFTHRLKKLEGQLSYEMISLPFSPYRLENHPLVQEADIIHLHWISKMIDYPTFFKKVQKPMVWTLHDKNPFLGLFHYEMDVQRNPIAKKLNIEILKMKEEAVSHIQRGAVVTPSQWLLHQEKTSAVFTHFNTHTCIYNSLGINFKEVSREASRELLGISLNENVVLFSAGTLDNPRKGLDLLVEALTQISLPISLVTLGKGKVNIPNENIKVIPLGYKSSPEAIAPCYAAADVFVLPSREDNLPNTMLESLAQGTPVISFGNGGMKEIIKDGVNGIIVPEITADSLRKAIEDFFSQKEHYQRETIKKNAQEQFHHKKQAEAYKKVYELF